VSSRRAVVVSEAPDDETVATLTLAAERSGSEPTSDRRRGLVRLLAYRWGVLVERSALPEVK
jgi:hypothetical protein